MNAYGALSMPGALSSRHFSVPCVSHCARSGRSSENRSAQGHVGSAGAALHAALESWRTDGENRAGRAAGHILRHAPHDGVREPGPPVAIEPAHFARFVYPVTVSWFSTSDTPGADHAAYSAS